MGCVKAAEKGTGRPRPPRAWLLSDLEIDRRGLALLAALESEAQLLALLQIAKACLLDGRDVNEHILGAVVRLNEAAAGDGAAARAAASAASGESRDCRAGALKPSAIVSIRPANLRLTASWCRSA